MDYQEQILNFLQQPENLPVALEVARQVEALRPHMHRLFWDDISHAINTRLSQSSFPDRWAISSAGDFDRPYRNLTIRSRIVPDSFKGSILVVGLIQHRPPSYQLQYGLLWSPKDRPAPDCPTFRKLMDLSQKAGAPEKNQDFWWPANNLVNIFLRSDEFMLQYGLNRQEFIDNLADKIWSYFTTLELTLYEFNQELFQGQWAV